jgi:hypothetical protein
MRDPVRGTTHEILVQFPAPRDLVKPVSLIRGAYLLSSLKGLRARGHYEAYSKSLAPERHDAIGAIQASEWLPIDLGIAHYAACEALDLPTSEVLELGGYALKAAYGSLFGVIGKLASESGLTPASVFGQADRYRQRMFVGSALEITRIGPKELRIEHAGLPLARFRYNRVGMRGILLALGDAFSRKAYVTELTAQCTSTSLAFRIAWA